jgi:hypothetical protein
MNPAENAKFSVDLTKRQLKRLDEKIARQITELQRKDFAALLSEDQKPLKDARDASNLRSSPPAIMGFGSS